MAKQTAGFVDHGLTPEQMREAVRGHYYEYPGMDGEKGEIWCYTRRYAYPAGARVDLHISSSAPLIDLEIARDGAVETVVCTQSNIPARWQETPEDCSIGGCGWEVAHSITIPQDWPSGAYRVTLRGTGPTGEEIVGYHMFIVHPLPGAKPGRMLQVAATGTWTAYNTWGGSNHYQGLTGPGKNKYSPIVSIERPLARGFVMLPPDAPRVPLEPSIPPAMIPRYPHMEWAYATGHSRKYASSGWASYDSHFFRWAERQGYAVDFASQHELHFMPELLEAYDCVVFVGHDEYWTWEMRDAVESYVARGGRVARFAGNFMWQSRLEDEGARHVCYKYRARDEDPVYRAADRSRTSGAWEDPHIGRPGARTFGLNATNGLYAGWGGCAPRGTRGFPVYRPEHWAFAGTGLYYGDQLGVDSHVYGYEVDGLDYIIRNGLPEATPDSGAPEGLQILALGLSSLKEESADVPAEHRFMGDADARFVARLRFGSDDAEYVERVKRGCGMIVNFPMGKGEVFHAGSCEWIAGLLKEDPMVEKVTMNVLNKYLRKPV
ncbi:N,N-dimethylformamidase beta subunit family domain-containing protein [Aquamicrobium defluvii]|uniref:N,N-dimethylformamidase beta subunit-like C-terminal domain-containing protein n=1 Tax=Aquamicrobium defluvii TaxID=69279 RepID=A0A011V1J8_9HYPH|nr:N,N-dimethylformamidase beta subunit family domain-containing protein [Aquamicrobium defluvii]EXL02315.1 hypothetical protein BG36_15305 [Aquamicrobium defluvii]EZQ13029.1 hypothetical protein CF98_29985 [Halopseudomonas bauzanensis]TDR32644.1 hypothetical protein DES43_12621 [Aquamicrobium defluvii]